MNAQKPLEKVEKPGLHQNHENISVCDSYWHFLVFQEAKITVF